LESGEWRVSGETAWPHRTREFSHLQSRWCHIGVWFWR
jgi:hypothetical protein